MDKELQLEIIKRLTRGIYDGGIGGSSKGDPKSREFLKMYLDLMSQRNDLM